MQTVAVPPPLALEIPVLFLVFNRPETTARVFQSIRQARPRRLYVAADGPRPQVPTDAARCAATRAIATAVDWDCTVTTLFRTRNLGCRMAVSSGITWFFQQVEEGIILEDDTLPVPDFFPFCAALLDYYRDDPRVMHIGGANYQLGARPSDGSYYFSVFNHIWGWATWRRAWRLYDAAMVGLGALKRNRVLERIFPDPSSQAYWLTAFEKTARAEIDTWDYQWTMTIWNNSGLAVLPGANLVTNIGFGPDATHTTGNNQLASLPVGDPGALRHPRRVEVDLEADAFSQRYLFSQRMDSPDLLALDVAATLEAGQPDKAASLAARFRTLYPNAPDLALLELTALALAGQHRQALARLGPFLAAHPENAAGRTLLNSLKLALRGFSQKTETGAREGACPTNDKLNA